MDQDFGSQNKIVVQVSKFYLIVANAVCTMYVIAIIVFCLYRNSFKKLHFIYFAKLQPYEQRMFLRMCK